MVGFWVDFVCWHFAWRNILRYPTEITEHVFFLFLQVRLAVK
jgi:hypothetical protein